jgi:hypothetical protein
MKTKTRERLVSSVKNGVPGTSMAPWGRVLGDEASGRLVDYVLEAWSKGGQAKPPTGRDTPAANPVVYSRKACRGRGHLPGTVLGLPARRPTAWGPTRRTSSAPAQPPQRRSSPRCRTRDS